jgi:hypothetical protein
MYEMAHHKFKVGQIVEPAIRRPTPAGPSTYEITSLVPSEGQEPRYRVKREGAPERVVAESQLVFVADAPVKPTRPSISVSGSKGR